MGEQAAKLLEKINTNQLNVSALISQPQLNIKNYSGAKKKKRAGAAYEGYSNRARRNDQVELILSTLDNNLREKKYVDTSTYRQKQGTLVLPQITKHAKGANSPSAFEFMS